jgi:hypothetical protein
LFGSIHHGERATAASKADELVRSLGLTWRDVIVAPGLVPSQSDWRATARFCVANMLRLSGREADFIVNLARGWREPTAKQLAWLDAIAERLRR